MLDRGNPAKVIRINALIDKNYKLKLIDFEDRKTSFLRDYICYDEVVIDDKKIPVKIKISPLEYSAYTYKHIYGDRFLNINVEMEFDKDNVFFFEGAINSVYDICYEGYILKKDKDTFYVVKLYFDESKDFKYMSNKMFYIKEMVKHKKKDYLIEGAFLTKSLGDKIERLELVYLILMNKVLTGKIADFQ